MYKFYISAVVGIIIEWLDNMHGVTMKKKFEIYNTWNALTNVRCTEADKIIGITGPCSAPRPALGSQFCIYVYVAIE